MIQKIKDLMQIKELIDNLTNDITNLKQEFDPVKSELTNIKQQFNTDLQEMKSQQKEFIASNSVIIKQINESRQEFDKEITDFKLQKTNMQKQMMEQGENELKDSLERIKADVASYNELKNQVNTISSHIENLSGEINKFTAISRNLKEKDFALEKFSNKIFEADQEKLELMRKIDALQRLIARERRSK